MPIKTFHDSTHAGIHRREREVSIEAMKDVVNSHDSKTQQYLGMHGGFVYRFSKTIDVRKLTVIAEIKKEECWLISAFYPCDI